VFCRRCVCFLDVNLHSASSPALLTARKSVAVGGADAAAAHVVAVGAVSLSPLSYF